jgi:sugar lactone lactonase YvrE
MTDTAIVCEGLCFPESPSMGPDGRLYVSDFFQHTVLSFDPLTWESTQVAHVPAQPSGLGWLPDGRMLVVSMRDMKLLRLESDGTLSLHADLSSVARGAANDMKVDAQGRAWVGSFGFDFYGEVQADPTSDPLFGPDANPTPAALARVDPDGQVTSAAEGLRFPNGTVQLSDGTLVIAETVGACLTAFSISDDGRLVERKTLLDLSQFGPDRDPVYPDGICVDKEDGIWISDPAHHRAIRVDAKGALTDAVTTSQPCFAVGLTGDTEPILVCCTTNTIDPDTARRERPGKLETVVVRVGPPSR